MKTNYELFKVSLKPVLRENKKWYQSKYEPYSFQQVLYSVNDYISIEDKDIDEIIYADDKGFIFIDDIIYKNDDERYLEPFHIKYDNKIIIVIDKKGYFEFTKSKLKNVAYTPDNKAVIATANGAHII